MLQPLSHVVVEPVAGSVLKYTVRYCGGYVFWYLNEHVPKVISPLRWQVIRPFEVPAAFVVWMLPVPLPDRLNVSVVQLVMQPKPNLGAAPIAMGATGAAASSPIA